MSEMQNQRMLQTDEATILKARKKKTSTQKASKLPAQGGNVKGRQELTPSRATQKASKRGFTNDVHQTFQQSERSTSDSFPDSSSSGNEYRALRRKYLLLEEESFELGEGLREIEEEVKFLEQEKLTILDELVVLEGLVDPSELQPRGLNSPLS